MGHTVMRTLREAALLLCTFGTLLSSVERAPAQSLNWEGQTGVFVTPLAYSAPSKDRGFGMPAIAYHYLDGGEVLGGFHQASITLGAFNRIEFGYTRNFQQQGSTPVLSTLWSSGFNIFHAKAVLLPEPSSHKGWRPTLSAGFVVRSQVRNVTGTLEDKNVTNVDGYIVATKTLTAIPKLPLVLNLGYKVTNASLLGIVGNSPAYKGRLFGAVAVAIKGPGQSTIMLASEFLQEPREVEGLPGAVVPTTITYAVRLVPSGTSPYEHGWSERKPKFNIDLGIAQAAGRVMPGVDLRARSQFALGISYGF